MTCKSCSHAKLAAEVLHFVVFECPSVFSFSHGQRQLLCCARLELMDLRLMRLPAEVAVLCPEYLFIS